MARKQRGETAMPYDDAKSPLAPIALVEAGEESEAIGVLTSAFAQDPVIRWMYPEMQQYLTHFPGFLTAFGGKAFAARTVWRIGDFDGAALWMPPDVFPDGDSILAKVMASVAQEKHEDLFEVFAKMDEHHPIYPHWYLPWFGIDAALQDRGLGSQLLKECLKRVDEDHLPAYLESPNPRNISFYERHGFALIGEARAGACPPVSFMLRDAR